MKKTQKPFFFLIILGIASITLWLKVNNDIASISLEAPKWTIKFEEDERIVSQPSFINDELYLQTNQRIYVYKPIDGTLLWAAEIPFEEIVAGFGENVRLIKDDTKLVVQSQRNLISVFDSDNGSLIWSSSYPAGFHNRYPDDTTFVTDTSVIDDSLLVARHNTVLTAYNINTGKAIWQSEIPLRTSLKIMPTNNKVYVRTLDTILVYELSNGTLLQTYSLPGDNLSYYLAENMVYLTFDNGNCVIASLKLENLLLDWCVGRESKLGSYYHIGMVDNEYIYAYGDSLVALDRLTGKIAWNVPAKREFQSMTELNGYIYAVDAGCLDIFDKHNGARVKRLKIPVEITNSIFAPTLKWEPVITKDSIVLFTKNSASGYNMIP